MELCTAAACQALKEVFAQFVVVTSQSNSSTQRPKRVIVVESSRTRTRLSFFFFSSFPNSFITDQQNTAIRFCSYSLSLLLIALYSPSTLQVSSSQQTHYGSTRKTRGRGGGGGECYRVNSRGSFFVTPFRKTNVFFSPKGNVLSSPRLHIGGRDLSRHG